jgi:hypothetical protein
MKIIRNPFAVEVVHFKTMLEKQHLDTTTAEYE